MILSILLERDERSGPVNSIRFFIPNEPISKDQLWEKYIEPKLREMNGSAARRGNAFLQE